MVRVLEGGGYQNTQRDLTAAKSINVFGGLMAWRSKSGKKSDADKKKDEDGEDKNPGAVTDRDLEKGKNDAPNPIQRTHTEVEFDEPVSPTNTTHGHRNSYIPHISNPLSSTSSRRVTHPHWAKRMWEDVRVGDFIKVYDGESLPADILICASSEDDGVAFVETKNLDGETNLKSRNAVEILRERGWDSARGCASAKARVDCDRPESDMFRLNAAVVLPGDEAGAEIKVPVDISMTLLRGTILRNTGWVVGLVLFTGEDSKIVLNSGGTPSKRSKVERQMNPQVYVSCPFYLCFTDFA